MIRKQEITTFEFPEDAIIWDVRDSSAYAEAHVERAINQPITELSFSTKPYSRCRRINHFVSVVAEVKRHVLRGVISFDMRVSMWF